MVRLVLAAALAAVVLLGLEAEASGSPLLVYYNDRPPLYEVKNESGYLVDITKLILETAGLSYRLVSMPSNRILELVKEGQPPCLGIGWFEIPERESWADFSKPIYQDRRQVALVNRLRASRLGHSVSLDSLLHAGLLLGKKDGYSFGGALDAEIAGAGTATLALTSEISQILRLVGAGRLDFTILSAEEAEYLLRTESGLGNVVILPISDAPVGNVRHLMYSKGFDRGVRERIDAAIDRVLLSPAYRRILDSYGLGG